MSGAIRMQRRGAVSRRPGARRVLAALTGVWLVAFGVLALRHESRVAHYIDAESGVVFHASGMLGEHTSTQSDIHPADAAPDHDACGISSAFHQASSPAVAYVQLAVGPEALSALIADAARSVRVANQLVYRLAPKTSPPAVA